MNYYKKVAQMLGLELNEEAETKGYEIMKQIIEERNL